MFRFGYKSPSTQVEGLFCLQTLLGFGVMVHYTQLGLIERTPEIQRRHTGFELEKFAKRLGMFEP